MTDLDTASAPNFEVYVNNNRLAESISSMITSIECESAEQMADLIKIQIGEVFDDQGRFLIANSKNFMPGNRLDVLMGYSSQLRHVCSAIIRRVCPHFPASGMPTIEVTAYSADSQMGESSPEPLKEIKELKATKGTKKRQGKAASVRISNSKAGRRWVDAKYSDAVRERAGAYGFIIDVDETMETPSTFQQLTSLSDYAFIAGLSNISGYLFWVDGKFGDWTLHFKNPQRIKESDIQSKIYTFKYGDGDYSTLLDFEPELAIQGAVSKLLAQSKDPITGQIFEVVIEEEADSDPDTVVETGNIRSESDQDTGAVGVGHGRQRHQGDARDSLALNGNGIKRLLNTGSDIKVIIGEWAFDVHANHLHFESDAQLGQWAAEWFRKSRERYILARGTLIGNPELRCRQTHEIVGLGIVYDGFYHLTRVRHMMSEAGGYTIDFNARKVVNDTAPMSLFRSTPAPHRADPAAAQSTTKTRSTTEF